MEDPNHGQKEQQEKEGGPQEIVDLILDGGISEEQADKLFKRAEDIATWSFWPLEPNRKTTA